MSLTSVSLTKRRAHDGLDVGGEDGDGALVVPDSSHHVSLLHHLHFSHLQALVLLSFLAASSSLLPSSGAGLSLFSC